MRTGLFWLTDGQWARIEPLLPTGLTGPDRADDRRIISGIIHMLQSGARWRDCPLEFGPYTTVYNRFKVGQSADDGAQSLRRWPSPAKTLLRCLSIRPRSKVTGAPPAEKGGAQSSNRPLARRPDDKNPCAERSALPASRPASDPRPGCRYHRGARCSGGRAAYERAPRRQRI